MGYVRHTYDSPTPNEEHELSLEPSDVKGLDTRLEKEKQDVEDLTVFLQI